MKGLKFYAVCDVMSGQPQVVSLHIIQETSEPETKTVYYLQRKRQPGQQLQGWFLSSFPTGCHGEDLVVTAHTVRGSYRRGTPSFVDSDLIKGLQTNLSTSTHPLFQIKKNYFVALEYNHISLRRDVFKSLVQRKSWTYPECT